MIKQKYQYLPFLNRREKLYLFKKSYSRSYNKDLGTTPHSYSFSGCLTHYETRAYCGNKFASFYNFKEISCFDISFCGSSTSSLEDIKDILE